MEVIHYYVHGRGRGHSTRSTAVVQALRADGHRVEVFAGDDASHLIRELGAHPVASLLPDTPALAAGRLVWARVREARDWARRTTADLVVSDGDLPGLLAARSLGIPSIAVGHGIVFSHCRRPRIAPRAPWWKEHLKARLSTWGATRRVAVNFASMEPRAAGVVVAHPPAVDLGREAGAGTDRIVVYFRDANADPVLRALVELGEEPIVFSARGSTRDGVDERPFDRSAFLTALRQARAVVASAGSQLIWECVSNGIPLFAVHGRSDAEQGLNVHMLRASGLGDGAPLDRVSARHLGQFLSRARESAPTGGSGSGAWGPDAVDAVADLVRELLGR